MTFPINSLPPAVRLAIQSQVNLGSYDVSAVGTAALAIMSHAAQGLFNVVDPSRAPKTYPLSQYFMILANSGDAKSAIYDQLQAGITRWQDEQRMLKVNEDIQYEIDLAEWERHAKSGDVADPVAHANAKPRKPKHRHNVMPKFTINGLMNSLEEGWDTLAIFNDEAGAQFGGYAFTKENGLETVSMLTSLWDRGSASRVTGMVSQHLTAKRVTALMMMQPKVSSGFLTNPTFAEQGIHARFHIVRSAPWQMVAEDFTDPAVKARRVRALDGLATFNNRVYTLLNTPLPFDEFGRLQPDEIQWTADAEKEAIALVRAFAVIRNDPDSHTYSKRMWEHTCRMAGVLAVFADDYPVITPAIVKAAWELVQFYADQWNTLDVPTVSENHSQLQGHKDKLLKRLKTEPNGLSRRDIARCVLQRMDTKIVEAVITELLKDDYIEAAEITTGTKTKTIYSLKVA